jgi:hypothetical protein
MQVSMARTNEAQYHAMDVNRATRNGSSQTAPSGRRVGETILRFLDTFVYYANSETGTNRVTGTNSDTGSITSPTFAATRSNEMSLL